MSNLFFNSNFENKPTQVDKKFISDYINSLQYAGGMQALKKGSKIQIKKENRGKFTEYCGGKVTQDCISKGKNSPDPKIRKRATFAANSRKWTKKHQFGGIVDAIERFYWHKIKAPKDYSDETAVLRNGQPCKECAKWSNDYLQGLGFSIYGDAWTRTNNKKLKKIVSGYDVKKKPKKYSEEAYDEYINNASDSVKKVFDTKLLNPKKNYIVGLQYKNSVVKKHAFKHGSKGEVQTHTGHLVFDNGQWYVDHNVGGNIIRNKIEDVIGSDKTNSIVSIYQVNK